jgi:hypothetical protein
MDSRAVVPQRAGLGVIAPILTAMIIIFATLTLLAGLPPADRMVSFWLGIVVLIAVTTGIGLVGWHLLLRPLPANIATPAPIQIGAGTRNIIALFLTLGTLSIGIAGVWDEIWHSKYGIPFGEDFFWRPHLMLYFSFLTLIVLGGWSWFTLQMRGKGTLQQRFRANPMLGVSFLAGAFTIYAVGADPIWHKLYGSDIAPWSVPHLLILTMILVMGMLAIAYHNSLMPAREWKVGISFAWRDVLIAFVLVGALIDYMLIFTIQWYAANPAAANRQYTQIMGYPDWLLAVFITFLAALFGSLALESTRRIGSATLVGVLSFGVRFLLDRGFAGVREGTTPLLLIVPLMLTLDIVYAVYIQRTKKAPPIWLAGGVIGVVFGIVGYPLVSAVFPFIPVTLMNIPGRIIASAITAAGSMWLVRTLMGMSSSSFVQTETSADDVAKGASMTSALVYVVFGLFLVFFITTATPPV